MHSVPWKKPLFVSLIIHDTQFMIKSHTVHSHTLQAAFVLVHSGTALTITLHLNASHSFQSIQVHQEDLPCF